MPRAAKACSHGNCPELQPCPIHSKEAWAGSTRRQRLRKPSGHRQSKLRRFVLHRDDHRCHICGEQFDPEQLVNDHVEPVAEGGSDDVTNMAPCCTGIGTNRCHERKTQEEARRGRNG